MNLLSGYMGLALRNPLIATASALTDELGTLRALEDHGAAAVVLPSLFEEQLRAERAAEEHRHALPASGCAEAQTHFPAYPPSADGAKICLRSVQRAKTALDIPIIASLNCLSPKCRAENAVRIAEAGADALELNLGAIPAAPELPGREVEQACVQAVAAVRAVVRIPVAVKIGP